MKIKGVAATVASVALAAWAVTVAIVPTGHHDNVIVAGHMWDDSAPAGNPWHDTVTDGHG